MRTHTGRPHDVRRVGSYENVPRLCLLCSDELPPLTGALPLGQGSVTPRVEGGMGPGGPQYIGKWLFVWRLGGVVLARLGVGVGSLPRTATS